jgi:hypothetical protein
MIYTDQEKQDSFVFNAYHREVEIHQYQINIDNYAAILSQLPQGDWDSDIQDYVNTPVLELPHSLTDEQVDRINNFQYRDRLRGLIRTERAEQNKSQRILDALKSQIVGDYDTLIQQVKQSQP